MGQSLTNAWTPTADPADERAGIAAAIGAAIIYGAAYPATAVALRSFSPLAVAGLSCTLALVLVVALAVGGVLPRTSDVPMTAQRLVRLVTLAGLGGVLFIVGTNLAVAISGPTITGFVAPLYAVFATVLAVPLLGERMRPSMVVAFALAFIGTAFLAGTVPTGTPPAGVLLALAAAAMFGLYLVLARRWGRPYQLDGTLITIANLVGRGPLLLAVARHRSGGVIPATIEPVAIVALLSIVFGSSTSGNLLVMASVRRVRASRTAGALLLTPLASAAIAAVVLGERLSVGGMIGAALILVAMAVAGGLLRRLARAQRAPA